MMLPIQVTTRHVTLTATDEAMINEEARGLERFAERIVSCRVVVEAPHRRQRTGTEFNVRIDLGLPQGELAVTKQSSDNLRTAVQRAFEAARRRMQDHVRELRGDVKSVDGPPTATVVKLVPFEGYGFLMNAEGEEIYFHRNSVLEDAFDRLEEGMDVRYAETDGEKGPQATTVTPIWRTTPAT